MNNCLKNRRTSVLSMSGSLISVSRLMLVLILMPSLIATISFSFIDPPLLPLERLPFPEDPQTFGTGNQNQPILQRSCECDNKPPRTFVSPTVQIPLTVIIGISGTLTTIDSATISAAAVHAPSSCIETLTVVAVQTDITV